MKKILFILPLIFIGNITLAQTRPGWANCNIGSNTLFDGTQCPARTTCVRAQGTNDDARYGTGCGDPQQVNLIPQLGGGQDNNKEEVKESPKDNPCDQTLKPQKNAAELSWQKIMAQYMNRPAPQKAYPLPAGPTTNSFSAGARIVAGGPTCKYQESPEEVIFNTCVAGEDAIRSRRIGARLEENYWNQIYEKCERKIINGVVVYPKAGKMVCGTANVFDALWGFLTHRKPY